MATTFVARIPLACMNTCEWKARRAAGRGSPGKDEESRERQARVKRPGGVE
jgi:hypothetical protein